MIRERHTVLTTNDLVPEPLETLVTSFPAEHLESALVHEGDFGRTDLDHVRLS